MNQDPSREALPRGKSLPHIAFDQDMRHTLGLSSGRSGDRPYTARRSESRKHEGGESMAKGRSMQKEKKKPKQQKPKEKKK